MKEFKKAFVSGVGGTLGVLAVPAIAYGIYLIYPPAIQSLQKKEYLEWADCAPAARREAINKRIDGTYDGLINNYKVKKCGEKPNRWKWQKG